MKKLQDILYGVALLDRRGSGNDQVQKLHFDSRQVGPGSLFVAIRGSQSDGHAYIAQAVAQGASVVVCEDWPAQFDSALTYLRVKDSARALALMAANFYDQPSRELNLVGVTGTNGKTTVASLLYRLLSALGLPCGLLSTVEVRVGEQAFPATHTTPDPVQINAYLRQMVDAGCAYCFMEASSHGLDQQRTAGLRFAGAVFTNISHDHLDYHGSFSHYLQAKKRLFDGLDKEAFALVNGDDRHAYTMLQHCAGRRLTFAQKGEADYMGRILEHQLGGMLLRLGPHEVWTRLIGAFNVYNLLAIYATAVELGFEPLAVATAISQLEAVAGRFQYLQRGGLTAVVDYAHTPDALKNVLETISDLRSGNERVITVVGCGGNRDAEKRPLMAQIATEYSDQVILTSDNPRFEEPEAIIADMQKGVEMHLSHKVLSIVSRAEAIRTALTLGQSQDIVLIAGKGHEKYQELRGERLPFDDLALAQETLQKKYP